MRALSVLLIEPNFLIREGLKSCLENADYKSVEALDCIKGTEALKKNRLYDLIIMDVDCVRNNRRAFLSDLTTRFNKSRIILLSSSLDTSLVTDCFSSGAHGLLLKDISKQAFLGSLNLVIMGEKVFPTSMANLVSTVTTEDSGQPATDSRSKPAAKKRLSKREHEVLKCLESGESNKEIARKLNITEATVKVHLKSILRKLDVSNRTQAAIWSLNKKQGQTSGGPVVEKIEPKAA